MSEANDSRAPAQRKAFTRYQKMLREKHARVHELATLAAVICPKVCQQNPSRAIEIAKALQVEAWRKTTEDDRGAIGLARVAIVAEGITDEGLRKAFLEETWTGPGKDGLPGKLAEYFDTLLGRFRPFERGVKLITQENRFDRAMPLFRRFVRSTRENEKACEEAIDEARDKGFSLLQLIQLTNAFPDWKAKEKSRIARTKSAKRKKKHQL